ncbi:MAG: FAD-dependent oxidoreductase [Lachnospiraceae bacterium]
MTGDYSSLWTNTCTLQKRDRLIGDKKADVLVIGCGITGILTAYFLKQQNYQVILLDADKIAGGQTKNTTAKITCQHGAIYQDLIKYYGYETTKVYSDAMKNAINLYKTIIHENNIDCNFEIVPSYLYTKMQEKKLEKEAEVALQVGICAELTNKTALPFTPALALKYDRQAQFHPLKFLKFLCEDLEIYENSKVLNIEGNKAITENGSVFADHIVVASHYPFINIPGFYFTRLHQDRSYVLALKQNISLDGMYYGIDPDSYSFRNYEDYLLLGGCPHRTGKNKYAFDEKSYGGAYDILRKAAKKWYPTAEEIYRWSAQDCIPAGKMPYIGKYSSRETNIYTATGFQKWGMTSSMVAAKILSDKIVGNDNPYASIFNPQSFRPIPTIGNILSETTHAVIGLSSSILPLPQTKLKNIKKGTGAVISYRGKKVGVYRSPADKLYAVSAICPHLGCKLRWNQDELSWDCPCHGSRFDYKGNLIDNPSKKELKHVTCNKNK